MPYVSGTRGQNQNGARMEGGQDECSVRPCILCAPCPACSVVPAARKPSQRELRFGTIVDQDAATLASGPTPATTAVFLASSQRKRWRQEGGRTAPGGGDGEVELGAMVASAITASTPRTAITSSSSSSSSTQPAAREGIPWPCSPLSSPHIPAGHKKNPQLQVPRCCRFGQSGSLGGVSLCPVLCSTVPPCAVPSVPGIGAGWVLYVLCGARGTWCCPNSVLRTALPHTPHTVPGAAHARPEHLGNSY